MSEVIITVRGEHELRVAPERATVHLTVAFDGPDRAQVAEQALLTGAAVREGLETRKSAGNVTEWTSQRLNVFADRPWNNEGRQLAPVHRASIDLTATFSDVSEMSVWVTELTVVDGVSIGHVDWHLTPQTEAAVEREVATRAVGVAVSRAGAYAEALGLSTVTPLEIADRGLLSEGSSTPPRAGMMRSAVMAMDSAPAMDFRGEEITVSATVEGRFTAR